MAGTSTPFHVQATVDNPQAFPHHESVSRLWSTKWRALCARGIYPFGEGKVEDFDPIFDQLISTSNDDVNILYQPDEYAKPFFPVAERLSEKAAAAEQAGKTDEARDLYLRAACVYRIARFPINRSELSQRAWEAGKVAYAKAGQYLDPPNQSVEIPFTHKDLAAGDTDVPIQAYLRVPHGEPPAAAATATTRGWPVLLFICGLDAYRTDHTARADAHAAAGFAVLSVEIPGTGDCPGAANDPTAPDRVFSSLFDWIVAAKEQYGFNPDRVVARGVSTGGYYAFRVAHTHAQHLFAAVAQGGGSHDMFAAAWIDAQKHMEYPFALADALAAKFGYASVAEYKAAEPRKRYSLLENGILELDSCRLLCLNGMEDSIFPIEDTILVASTGRVKDVRLQQGKAHMGNPGGEEILYAWIKWVMAGSP